MSKYKKTVKPYTLAEVRAMKVNQNKEWYTVRSIVGNTWAIFFILLGAREAGKSYNVMDFFLREWKKKKRPFYWIRLTEPSKKKMLQNKAMKLIDADLRRRFKLNLTVKGDDVYDSGKLMCTVLALSTFYNDKGVAMYDNEYFEGYNIALDEMNRERNEKRTFDINYAFVNQMENIVRSTKEKMRVFLIGNTLEEASDILTSFNFIPEEFGRYKLKKKRAVIDYIPPTEAYLKRRKGTVADLLTPDEATFTNIVKLDNAKIYKGRLTRPTNVIKFDRDTYFTLWDGSVITEYNNEKCEVIAMRAYIHNTYVVDTVKKVFARFHADEFSYRSLITLKKFRKEMALIKANG